MLYSGQQEWISDGETIEVAKDVSEVELRSTGGSMGGEPKVWYTINGEESKEAQRGETIYFNKRGGQIEGMQKTLICAADCPQE